MLRKVEIDNMTFYQVNREIVSKKVSKCCKQQTMESLEKNNQIKLGLG